MGSGLGVDNCVCGRDGVAGLDGVEGVDGTAVCDVVSEAGGEAGSGSSLVTGAEGATVARRVGRRLLVV